MPSTFNERPHQNEKAEALEYISKLIDDAREKSDNEAIPKLENLLRLVNGKRYGLVWEEHAELVDEKMKTEIPVFVEDETKKIVGNSDSQDYNFLLEGDNLHSLHLLQKTHAGKIDVIYIDPPYNTGSDDFIYNDKIISSEDKFIHSKWLSFMKSRLEIARNLLSDKGVIAVSIDYHEGYQLKLLMDEIFGEENFATDLHVETSAIAGPRRISAMNGSIVKTTEFIFIYTKIPHSKIINHNFYDKLDGFDIHYSKFLNPETGYLENFSATLQNTEKVAKIFEQYNLKPSLKSLDKLITVEDKLRKWLYSDEIASNLFRLDVKLKEKLPDFKSGLNYLNNKYVVSKEDGTQYTAFRYADRIGRTDGFKPSFGERSIRGNLWKGFSSDGGNLAKEGKVSFKNGKKPLRLIKQVIKALGTSKSVVVLDFFAGSGTTGHAVEQLNKEDGGNRKYILCTNNENNICEEVTYKRLKNIQDDLPHNLKYFKTKFVSKDDEDLEYTLLNNVKTLIELEHGIDLEESDKATAFTLSEIRDLDLTGIKTVYVRQHSHAMMEKEDLARFKDIELVDVPEYYFAKEMREAGL